MRDLHVVAVSGDGRHVVLAADPGATRGGFRVAIDDKLVAAVQADVVPPADVPQVPATPKEIQSRLRAGESVEQIAASSGMPLSKVERYAGPVLSERDRVLEQVRNSFVPGSRQGPTALRLGDAVDQRLADTTGVRLETVTWSARRERSGVWLVELSYVSQARRRKVGWRYDVVHREVTPADSAAARLSLAYADSESVVGVPVASAAMTSRSGRSKRGAASRTSARSGRAGASGRSAAAPAAAAAGASRSFATVDESSDTGGEGRSSRTVTVRRNGLPPAAGTLTDGRSDSGSSSGAEDGTVGSPARAAGSRPGSRPAAAAAEQPVAARTAQPRATTTRAVQPRTTATRTTAARTTAARTTAARTTATRTTGARTTADRGASTRAAADRRASAAASRTATATAVRTEQALAERKAAAAAERKAQAAAMRRERAAAARTAAAQVEREAQAAATRRAEALAQRRAVAAAQRSAAAGAAAERLQEQHVGVHAQTAGGETAGPPQLRVVGGGGQPRPRRDRRAADLREAVDQDRAARTGASTSPAVPSPAVPSSAMPSSAMPSSAMPSSAAVERAHQPADAAVHAAAQAQPPVPARVAGHRPSVPAWADVLLSTGPAAGQGEPPHRAD